MSHGGGGGDRWLVSYADLITVLMILFVVLYAMGQVDIQRYEQLADSLNAAFTGAPARIVDPEITTSGGIDDELDAAPILIPELPAAQTSTTDIAADLVSLMAGAGMGGDVNIQENIEGLLISVSEQLLFEAGTAQLQSQGYPALDIVYEILLPLDNEIRITGHTDTTPPRDGRYASNWELSVARAVTVVNYLVAKGFPPVRLTAEGAGEYRPLYPADSAQSFYNSRADIVVVYPKSPKLFEIDIFGGMNTSFP